jgi:AraC-like DNA-binding protein
MTSSFEALLLSLLKARRPEDILYCALHLSANWSTPVPQKAQIHEGQWHELLIPTRGQLAVATPKATLVLGPGQLLLVEPHSQYVSYCHTNHAEDVCDCCTYVCATCGPNAVLERRIAAGTTALSLIGDTDLTGVTRLLFEEVAKQGVYWHQSALALLRYLALVMLRRIRTGSSIGWSPAGQSFTAADPGSWKAVAHVLRYCAAHFRERGLVQKAARDTGYSRCHMSRLFREVTGMTLGDHVHGLRLQRGKHLLKSSDLPIESIAMAVGYSDYHSFRRAFQSSVGMSPGTYRGESRANTQADELPLTFSEATEEILVEAGPRLLCFGGQRTAG